MSLKHVIVPSVAAIALALSGTPLAETAVRVDETPTYQSPDAAGQPAPGSAEAYKHQKVDEATAADSKYHANRTEPNRVARDRAESAAAVAIDRANGVDRSGRR